MMPSRTPASPPTRRPPTSTRTLRLQHGAGLIAADLGELTAAMATARDDHHPNKLDLVSGAATA